MPSASISARRALRAAASSAPGQDACLCTSIIGRAAGTAWPVGVSPIDTRPGRAGADAALMSTSLADAAARSHPNCTD